jgi:hypothetical protein
VSQVNLPTHHIGGLKPSKEMEKKIEKSSKYTALKVFRFRYKNGG